MTSLISMLGETVLYVWSSDNNPIGVDRPREGDIYPAIIVRPGLVCSLSVFTDTDQVPSLMRMVEYSAEGKPGTWHTRTDEIVLERIRNAPRGVWTEDGFEFDGKTITREQVSEFSAS